MTLNPENKKDREKLRRLFLVKKTELQMILDRGFSIVYSHALHFDRSQISFTSLNYEFMLNPNLTFEEFLEWRNKNTNGVFKTRENFSSIYYKNVQNAQGQTFILPLLVMYLDSPAHDKTTGAYMMKLNKMMETTKYHNIILITEQGLSTKEINRLKTSTAGITFTYFQDSDLAFNRTKFALAPIRVIYYEPNQVPRFEEEEQLSFKQLPFITSNDLLSKWYGATSGGVFTELIMGVETSSEVFYRTVVISTVK